MLAASAGIDPYLDVLALSGAAVSILASCGLGSAPVFLLLSLQYQALNRACPHGRPVPLPLPLLRSLCVCRLQICLHDLLRNAKHIPPTARKNGIEDGLSHHP